MKLPSQTELANRKLNVGETVEELYPGLVYDSALPQEWLDTMIAFEFDPRGQVIWAYPNGSVIGMAAPLTNEAREHLRRLGQAYYDQDGLYTNTGDQV